MVSRRRRRQGIGKIRVSVESRVRRIEKNPSPKRLKANVVTTEKLGFRAVTTKTVAADAITANEAAFGATVVTDTQPTEYLKEGTTWVNPDDGSTNVYSTDLGDFVTVTDAAAVAIAQGKNKTYVQDNQPTGGSYSEGDLWIDTNDGNKLYAYVGTAWVLKQDGDIASALASANGKNTIYRQISQPSGGTYVTGDTWFDSDDNNKIYRYNGTTWVAVQLGGNGLANINANAITTGTIDASVITVSNLDAGNITTGTINVGGSIKISTSPSASGTTARVEINSTGFYAYNGSVATVSITNTGAAIFSGTVNATAGAFTGYVTAGTARFGAAVQTGKNGIYINATNYWYDDGSFKAGTGTSAITYDGSGTLTIGAGSSIGGTTASTLVSNAAEGLTALQPGNGVSDNGSDQITSISTASGIVIGTRVDGTGARVEMNSGGFFAYNGSTETVGITSAGDARFSGTITGSTFTSTNYASGTGISISGSSGIDQIKFNVGGAEKASLAVVSGGLVITSGSSQLTMTYAGAITLSSASNTLLMSAAPYFTGGSGSNTGGGLGSLRNTWASSSDPSGGDLGDVWLKWV